MVEAVNDDVDEGRVLEVRRDLAAVLDEGFRSGVDKGSARRKCRVRKSGLTFLRFAQAVELKGVSDGIVWWRDGANGLL